MTKERTREDWEHEGWIVGDGSLVGEERAGVYDFYDDHLGVWVDHPVSMRHNDMFFSDFRYKLVRPLPKLPESGCADRANALDSARDKLLHGHSLCDFCGREHTHFKNLGGKQKCSMCTIPQHLSASDDDLSEPKPIELVPGRWYVVKRKHYPPGFIEYARWGQFPATQQRGPCFGLVAGGYGGPVPAAEYEILAEAPSPEELLK